MVPVVPVLIVPVLTEHWRVDAMLLSFEGRIGKLICIDNGNSEWMPKTHKAQEVFVWRMPTNLGVAASWNLGIKATPFAAGWMLVNHDVQFGEGGTAAFYASADKTNIVLGGKPNWSCVWIGSQVVQTIGLFHEGFHPAYFEDNDFETRARRANIEVVLSTAAVNHRNSSTLASNEKFREKNGVTFQSNMHRFNERQQRPWQELKDWELDRRLLQSWD